MGDFNKQEQMSRINKEKNPTLHRNILMEKDLGKIGKKRGLKTVKTVECQMELKFLMDNRNSKF